MRIQYLFLFVFFAFMASCNEDDNKESIDYVEVTEKRLLEVSEQETISDEDIASLQRLIDKVEKPFDKERFNKVLEDVKRIQYVIPEIVKLRTDEDIDFQQKYTEVKGIVNMISDEIPRKAKLLLALEDAQNSYNEDEIEFDNTKAGEHKNMDGFPDDIREFLEEKYGIKSMEGNPYRYKRSEIEKVDSLYFFDKYVNKIYQISTWNVNIKKFKSLKFLAAAAYDEVPNFNSLTHLESLTCTYYNDFKIDNCENLKYLQVTPTDKTTIFPEMISGNPNLEEIVINGRSKTNIESIVIKNKPNLKNVRIGKIGATKSITIEGNGTTSLGGSKDGIFFSTTSKEVNLNLSGMKEIMIFFNKTDDQWKSVITSLSITNSPNLEKLYLSEFYLPQPIDLANYPNLKYLYLVYSSVNSFYIHPNERTLEMLKIENNIKNFDKLPLDIEVFKISDYSYPNNSKVLDLGKYKKINSLELGKTINSNEGIFQSLEKLIIDRQVYESIKGSISTFNLNGSSEHQVEIELVD